MSKKRCDFEHRTSIFEAAYRAWSQLEGLDLRSNTASEFEPRDTLSSTMASASSTAGGIKSGGSTSLVIPVYPHEPLPKDGQDHPFVQAIMDAWLGPNGDREGGLILLRTWWNHRRQGEGKSALNCLGNTEMRQKLEEYVVHFYGTGYNLKLNDNTSVQKLRVAPHHPKHPPPLPFTTRGSVQLLRRSKRINCIKEKLNLPNLEEEMQKMNKRPCKRQTKSENSLFSLSNLNQEQEEEKEQVEEKKKQRKMERDNEHQQHGNGERSSTKQNTGKDDLDDKIIVVTTEDRNSRINNIHQIALTVDGITGPQCIGMIEIVLNGCAQNASPIDGILSAIADTSSRMILIRIDDCSNAKRIATTAIQHLGHIGYIAQAKTTKCSDSSPINSKSKLKRTCKNCSDNTIDNAWTYIELISTRKLFDWSVRCNCSFPSSLCSIKKCKRHGQLSELTFDAFSLDKSVAANKTVIAK